MPSSSVIVGMSGGVDSAVTALLLRDAGYNVTGVFMRNWHDTDPSGACQAAADYDDVAATCSLLGIPYLAVDFSREYRDEVFRFFLDELKAGHTPNPDVLCNRHIKFAHLLRKAGELGADFLATGHYCRLGPDGDLLRGDDPGKDQSYFLATVRPEVFRSGKVLFPLGAMRKPEVRALAAKAGLPSRDKKDSTGICFIGERPFREFVSGYLPYRSGTFRTPDGEVVGRHVGAAFYTLGQRRGLGLGGEGTRWYVVAKDLRRNHVYVARDHDHPWLYSRDIWLPEVFWQSLPAATPFLCEAQVRYRQHPQRCSVESDPRGGWRVRFEEPQRAAAAGQYVVFYEGKRCLGGGMIVEDGSNRGYFPRDDDNPCRGSSAREDARRGQRPPRLENPHDHLSQADPR